jgi:hypothetical protein
MSPLRKIISLSLEVSLSSILIAFVNYALYYFLKINTITVLHDYFVHFQISLLNFIFAKVKFYLSVSSNLRIFVPTCESFNFIYFKIIIQDDNH